MPGPRPAIIGLASSPGLRSLPITVPLVRGESGHSLLIRLAKANHVRPDDLRAHLPRSPRRRPVLSTLAVLSGYPAEHLQLALTGRTSTWPCERRLACGHCMRRRGITQPVEIYTSPTQQICRRHRRWLTLSDDWQAEQYDLRPVPEVMAAHRRHLRLVRRHGAASVQAFSEARHILHRWTARGDCPEHRDRRLRQFIDVGRYRLTEHHPLMPMVNYPETVALSWLLADPTWAARLAEHGAEEFDRLAREVRRRLRTRHEPYGRDPLRHWAEQLREEERRRRQERRESPAAPARYCPP